MNAHSAMAVHTSNGIGCGVRGFGDWHLFPSPFMSSINEIFAALLASQH
jgi:hypothetical protein